MYSINLNLSVSILFFFIGTLGLLGPILCMSKLQTGIIIGITAGIGPYIASAMFFLEWKKERREID